MAISTSGIEQLSINTIRTLSMDAVQAANSGHPGTPMALAPVAYTLWTKELNYDPKHPHWPGRDRFVLSCGHASMLLYATLHLAGVSKDDGSKELAITLDDIRSFRQWGSPCAGHPEHGHAAGIETTTGPLGQGVSNSVGMAIAAKWYAEHFNKPGFELFDYNVYAVCSDGDLMEGISNEAASLAGHLKLSNLCWIYDDNKITIEGGTSLAFSENVPGRFEALGWHVIEVEDANDVSAIENALSEFGDVDDRPTLIVVHSKIAWGSPNKQGTSKAHGSPLGDDEIRLTKAAYGWPEDEKFLVPEGVRENFEEQLGRRGAESYAEWTEKFAEYKKAFPELAARWEQMQSGELPEGWDADIPTFDADAKGLASRVSSGKVLNAVAKNVPWLLGGSADLAPSTMTLLDFDGAGPFEAGSYGGRNFHFGIREHAMAAVINGMALSGLRPYGATFLVFSDYARGALRLSAIMEVPVIYVFTHDSIGVGEDGPTHQPIEHLAALRVIPGMITIRPGDANEAAELWREVMCCTNRPASFVLSRQNLPTLDRTKFAAAEGARRGAYVLADPEKGQPKVILIGTGSELSTCVEAYEQLTKEGIPARVVSMPSWELFEDQDEAYRNSVFPPEITARVALEAGCDQGWAKYLGSQGRFIGMKGFGASAPFAELLKQFGLTAENMVKTAKSLIA